MRYRELLEAKSPKAREIIKSRLGEKLLARIAEDNREKELSVGDLLDRMEAVDPTPNSIFVDWIIREYLSGRFRFIEDLPKATSPLERFNELKPKLSTEQRDIQKYKFLDLVELIKSNSETDATSNRQAERQMEAKFFETGAAELLRNDQEWKIVVPHSERASCYFGRNTQWCTAGDKENLFDKYYQDGYLYIILHKPTNRRWQLQFESKQFMDENDIKIKDQNLLGELFDLVGDHRSIELDTYAEYAPERAISKFPDRLADIASSNGWAILHIGNPSEEVQLAAVRSNGNTIRHIGNPSEEVQLAAVQQTGFAIRHISDPSEEVKLAAVQETGFAIQYIENPAEEVQLAAVRSEVYALDYIDNPSDAVRQAARA